MVGSKVFLVKPKHQFVYPNKENAFMVPSHEKNGDYYVNLCLPLLINELWLAKMVESEVFPYETKASIHLSQWLEWTCGAQSLKERKLLCEYVIIPIERWTLIPNLLERFSFAIEASISFIPMCLWCPILKRKKIITWIHVYPNWQTNFDSRNGGK